MEQRCYQAALVADIDKLLFEAIQRPQKAVLFGCTFDMLPTLENGLSLLEHCRHHLLEGKLGLRQVIDWMMYVNRVLDDAYWKECFKDTADACHLTTFAGCLTYMCQKYLGLPEEGHEWCRSADGDVCERLMRIVYQSGNFGRKIETGSRKTISRMNSLSRHPLRHLQSVRVKNWEEAQKHRSLRTVAWAYQGIQYIRKGLKRPKAITGIMSDMNRSSEQTKLFRRLDLF